MSEASVCLRYFVTGQVQGVCYRVRTQEQAQALQITGWVRNRRDGRVEVYACATLAQHQALKNWLEIGPSQAKVSNIEVYDAPFESCEQFAIRPTQ